MAEDAPSQQLFSSMPHGRGVRYTGSRLALQAALAAQAAQEAQAALAAQVATAGGWGQMRSARGGAHLMMVHSAAAP